MFGCSPQIPSSGSLSQKPNLITSEKIIVGTFDWVKHQFENAHLQSLIQRIVTTNKTDLELIPFLESSEFDSVINRSGKLKFTKKKPQTHGVRPNEEKVKFACLVRYLRSKIRFYYRSHSFQKAIGANLADAHLWSPHTVQKWMENIPVLEHLAKDIVELDLGGDKLLKLTEKRLVLDYGFECIKSRKLLLYYINVLKTPEDSILFPKHEEILNDVSKELDNAFSKTRTKTPEKERNPNSSFKRRSTARQGTSAWVESILQAEDLDHVITTFLAANIPLYLVPHMDESNLDTLFDPLVLKAFDRIRLICVLRKMRMIAMTQNSMDHLISFGSIQEWTVQDVSLWIKSIPTLRHLYKLFERANLNGRKLLRLNEKELITKYKFEKPNEISELLYYVSEFKSFELVNAFRRQKDIVEEVLQNLAGRISTISTEIPKTISQVSGKRVPNYFISLRISNPTISKNVEQVQARILEELKEDSKITTTISLNLLHFTLGRLYIQTQEDIEKAQTYLEECKSVVQKIYGNKDVGIQFKGITNYGGTTVFLETKRGRGQDRLIDMGNTVYELFRSSGLTSKEFRFQPVAPILRIRKRKVAEHIQRILDAIFEEFSTHELGKEMFTNLEISANAEYDSDGYYKCLHKVSWK